MADEPFCEVVVPGEKEGEFYFKLCKFPPPPSTTTTLPVAPTIPVAFVGEQPPTDDAPTSLAFTGAHTEILGSIGIALVAIGIAVRRFARRFA